MKKVLVTGGTGVLGRLVVQELQSRGVLPRVLSRKTQGQVAGVEKVQGDLSTGTGLKDALQGVEVVVHCAHNPMNAKENTLYTHNLIQAAKEAGVRHLVLISILGIDRMAFYPYYRAKLQDEQLVMSSGIPYTLLRAAQFHDFVGFLIQSISKMPVVLLPKGLVFQPVQLEPVAAELAHAALRPPAGRLPDLAGPEVLPLEQLTRSWLEARGLRKRVYTFPLPLRFITVWKELGQMEVSRKGETWQMWLSRQANRSSLYQKASN